MKNHISIKIDDNFIAQESVARLRATVCELDELIIVEKDHAALRELQQLKNKITSVLAELGEKSFMS